MKRKALAVHSCATCARPVEALYCSHCGERRITDHDRSIGHVIGEVFELLVHFDSKVVRSAGLLLRRPGFLTTEYWAGRRVLYMKPLQLLILLNLLYFITDWLCHSLGLNLRAMFPTLHEITNERLFSGLAAPVVAAKLAATHVDPQAYAAAFDEELGHLAKTLVILLVPILAVFLRVSYPRGRMYVDQLIAATHLVAFYVAFWMGFKLLLAIVLRLLALAGFVPDQTALLAFLRFVPVVAIGVYVAIALRTMYGQSWTITLAKALVFLFLVIAAVTNIYDFVLFLLAYALV